MSQNVKALTSQAAPWNKQVAWWLVAVEGGVALLLGLFVIFQPEQANVRFIQIVGGYLFVTSALGLYRILTNKEVAAREPSGYIRTGIGLVAGLVALFQTWMPAIDTAAATTILALGMLISGIIGLYVLFAKTPQEGRRWSEVIINFLYLIFAYAVFVHNRSDSEYSGNLVWWIGILTALGGVALIVYGFMLRRAAKAAVVAVPAAGVAATPQPGTTAGAQPASPVANSPQSNKAPTEADSSQSKG